jgi:hypothetical protein
MKQQTFVDALRQHVNAAAVEGVLAVLQSPPGRRPGPEVRELSGWYLGLTPRDRERVRALLTLTGHHVLFGVLAVLDGVRAIEGPGPKGHFELRYVSPSGESTTLVGAGAPLLHEAL